MKMYRSMGDGDWGLEMRTPNPQALIPEKKLKNFVLDFGGVLYEINHYAAFQYFFLLSKNPDYFSNDDMKEYLSEKLIIQFEKGLIEPVQFRNKAREKLLLEADDELFDKAFNATLVRLKPEAINCVKQLKNKGKVVLLSNTNEIHYNYFHQECKELLSLFDGLYFSYLLGSRKPEPEIFKILLQNTGFTPNETLFIDDSVENIATAKELGFATYMIDKEHTLSELIHNV
ncbi:MAG: HAD family phosphatase [Bacteroidetes bacterium]|nr:HAD family phosphatase [Bacteroidota bacterium]